jgi:sulfur carrier protein
VTSAIEGNSRAVDVVVNGEGRRVAAGWLAAVLDELGYGGQKVATALNGDFVPERARERTPVKAGDHIEVVAPRQGG